MPHKILIANRGEIACRIIKTAKKLGYYTIAVYSSVDNESLHVKLADEAYFLGMAPSRDSYLNIDKLIQIAKLAKVDAIHPGYGFLSENADFAEKCQEENLIFIGPPVSAIKAMASKSAAKEIAEQANVPLIPGYHGTQLDLETLKHKANEIGYPIMIKAAMGGGGKGMRIVHCEDDLKEAVLAAQREAKASFNDEQILLEKYIQKSRHVEIQIFADQYGNAVYLFERDCSLQRRHQKIIEEAPAFGLTNEIRQKMGETSLKLVNLIKYQGAGTLEYLFDGQNFYFMEMNTRLQVEHPVTEMITGLDLVEWQFRVAFGEKLPLQQENINLNGHAIEARIYAENPSENFLPSTGKIEYLNLPNTSESIRIDSGIVQGDSISPFYDPMIAKLIVWAETRERAVERLNQALKDFLILGVHSNLSFLQQIISESAYLGAEINTQYLSNYEFCPKKIRTQQITSALVTLSIFLLNKFTNYNYKNESINQDHYSPWFSIDSWRLNSLGELKYVMIDDEQHEWHVILRSIKMFQDKEATCKFSFIFQSDGSVLNILGQQLNEIISFTVDHFSPSHARILELQNSYHIFYEGTSYKFRLLNEHYAFNQLDSSSGHVNSPMPGSVISVNVKAGDFVKKGQTLLVLEAMKMEHTIKAPTDGIVKNICYRVGDLVQEGAELCQFEVKETQ